MTGSTMWYTENSRNVMPLTNIPCAHLGDANGELIDCPSCLGPDGRSKTRIKTFSCNIFGMCTLQKQIGATSCCHNCQSYTPTQVTEVLSERKVVHGCRNSSNDKVHSPVSSGVVMNPNIKPPVVDPTPHHDNKYSPVVMPELKGTMAQGHQTGINSSYSRVSWAYGITTVSSRFYTTLPDTLAHLTKAGFDNPTLYADDCTLQQALNLERDLKLPVVPRRMHHHEQRGIAWSNYLLALYDLCIRNRNATRVVLFQDDISCPRNLMHYLSSLPYPEKGYWNLYTGDQNEHIARSLPAVRGETTNKYGWFRSNQLGKGALALVFDRDGVEKLLGHIVTSQRVRSAKKDWTKNIDGWVQNVLIAHQGYTEYCHNPGLVQHRGVGQSTLSTPQFEAPKCYIGDDADCMDLLKK